MMKNYMYLILVFVLTSCTARKQVGQNQQAISAYGFERIDPPITQSLFDDKNSTITEENIQKILNGDYTLPNDLRVTIVELESNRNFRNYNWNNEEYLKSKQEFLDLFVAKFEMAERVKKVFKIPDMLISSQPTFTNIREAAVRTQSDIVLVYSIESDIYSNYKMFSKTEIKAFATTQLILLDVRTGLIPFTTIVTKEYQSKRQENELNDMEAANRIKNEAVLLTIEEIGQEIIQFLEN